MGKAEYVERSVNYSLGEEKNEDSKAQKEG